MLILMVIEKTLFPRLGRLTLLQSLPDSSLPLSG